MARTRHSVKAVRPACAAALCVFVLGFAAARAADVGPIAAPTSPEDARQLGAKQLRVPVAGIARAALRDTYNERRGDARPHEALDIAAPRGTAVVAVEDGQVMKLFTSAAGGLTIYHLDPTGDYVYYYAHLDRYADDLKAGQRLRAGQVIGYVGTTGNAPPNAPHLHFAIFRLGPEKHWWQGTAIDPLPFLH